MSEKDRKQKIIKKAGKRIKTKDTSTSTVLYTRSGGVNPNTCSGPAHLSLNTLFPSLSPCCSSPCLLLQLPPPHLLLLLLFITTAKALTCDYCTLPVLNKPHPLHSLSFLQHTPPPPFPRAVASLLPYLRPHFLLHRPSLPSSCLLTILDSSTSPTIFTSVTALTMLLPQTAAS